MFPDSKKNKSFISLFYQDPNCDFDFLELEKISLARYKLLTDLEIRHKSQVDKENIKL